MREELYHFNQPRSARERISFELCGTTNPDQGYKIHRRHARIICLEFVESGKGTVHLDGESFSPRAGDSYLLQAWRDQRYYSDPSDPWKKHFVNVSGPLAESLVAAYGLGRHSYFRGLDLMNEFSRAVELAKRRDGDCTPEMTSLFCEILLKMQRHVKKREHPTGVAQEAKDYLNRHVTDPFDMAELCRQVSRSESQTIRLFKQHFGTTPYAYLLSKRLELAQRLLDNTALTVREIAQMLCFSDEYYFSNLFKSKLGISPSQYRRRERE